MADLHVDPKEIDSMYDFARAVRNMGQVRRYCIVTLGCQMNVRDSQTMSGWLEIMGFQPTDDRLKADLIVYNTCCVRENAENKALGNVIWLKELKKDKPELIIGVCGCMMQQEGMSENLKDKYPFIDFVFGTHNAYRFPEYLYRVLCGERVFEVWNTEGTIPEGMPAKRESTLNAFVNIMYGCNNFCTYCIVPYVRGRERSRDAEDILEECRQLKKQGAREIMLLGQNVNSYMGGGSAFADLIKRVNDLGIERIRFMTSHPKDITRKLIDCFASCEHLCPALHLPVQAGNNEVLQRMNRRYTREKYLETVELIRSVCPNIGLTSDIIVGFPGETQEQFEDTMSLVRAVRYDAAYTFIYSPRAGTLAAGYEDPVTMQEKTCRIEALIDQQQKITAEILARQIGKTEEILVETVSARNGATVGGKTGRGHMVNFEGGTDLIGRIVKVKITQAGKNTLKGVMEA